MADTTHKDTAAADSTHDAGAASAHADAGASTMMQSAAGQIGAQALQRKIQARAANRAGGSLQLMKEGAGAAGGGDPGELHEAAAAGVSGSGAALPHLDHIQRAFGNHDVSGVRAHTGGAAAQAAGSMGAEAYATGNDVAFAGAPSLHTAAHEAAHVVQQQGGVQLKGGVGQEGDAHEQHADAVADRVVAGQSAEGLLASYGGRKAGAGAADGAAAGIQLKMDAHKASVAGAKGARAIFKDSTDNKLYSKLPSSTAAVWQLMEVTLVTESGAEKYKEVDGAAKRPWTVAHEQWGDLPGALAPPVAVATGWTQTQIERAGFTKKAANHWQKDEVDYLGYHVHVSAYKEGTGEYTSFHVKFDPGAEHISWFYSFAKGGKYDKPGQSEIKQKSIIKNFEQTGGKPAPTAATVSGIYDQLVAKSEAIAAIVRAGF